MSVISRKNQVTLPVDALREAGLRPGDDVRVQAVVLAYDAGLVSQRRTD